MKKHNWPFIFAFLFLFSFIVYSQKKKLPVKNNAPVGSTKFDSTKRYIYKMTIPANELSPTMDTLDMILNELGVTMSVEQSRQYKAIAIRNIRRLIGNPQLDSINIKK